MTGKNRTWPNTIEFLQKEPLEHSPTKMSVFTVKVVFRQPRPMPK